jgi:DNA-binding LytR/AlgR family response regulator
VRYTTSQIIALLPKKQFVKVNRSYIVNVKHITKIETKFVHIAEIKLLISKDIKEDLLLKI